MLDAEGHLLVDLVTYGHHVVPDTQLGDRSELLRGEITPEGHLICGFRRLEAAKALQWRTVRVWVRSGLSDELTRLLAERDENTTHKPLSPLEAARLYEELRTLVDEDADRRKKATQFGAKSDKTAGQCFISNDKQERHQEQQRILIL